MLEEFNVRAQKYIRELHKERSVIVVTVVWVRKEDCPELTAPHMLYASLVFINLKTNFLTESFFTVLIV